MENVAKARENAIAELEARIERLTNARNNTFEGIKPYIVRCGCFCLAFKVEQGAEWVASDPKVASADRATRFSYRDAVAVAAQVQNGAGERGKPVRYSAALEQEITEAAQVLGMLHGSGK